MNKLTPTEIKKLEKLNIEFSLIEEKIYNLAKLQNQIALKKILEKENNITDYELEVNISFYTNKDNDEIASWDEEMKIHFLYDIHHNINDKENHTIPEAVIKSKELNFETCCWLMYKLYIECELEWIDMLQITNTCFIINISYQYEIDIS